MGIVSSKLLHILPPRVITGATTTMRTIDRLLSELDCIKMRYDRTRLLKYLFEFASQFCEYNNLPKAQVHYEAIISWKLSGMVVHGQRNYEKNTAMAYQSITIPPTSGIPRMLRCETENWKHYWETISTYSGIKP